MGQLCYNTPQGKKQPKGGAAGNPIGDYAVGQGYTLPSARKDWPKDYRIALEGRRFFLSNLYPISILEDE